MHSPAPPEAVPGPGMAQETLRSLAQNKALDLFCSATTGSRSRHCVIGQQSAGGGSAGAASAGAASAGAASAGA